MVPFEDLLVMPGDVHDVHRRLVWPRDQQRLACERVHGPARLVSRDIQAGHADLVQQQPGGRRQGSRVGQEPFHGSLKTAYRSPFQQPGTALRSIWGNFFSRRIPQIP